MWLSDGEIGEEKETGREGIGKGRSLESKHQFPDFLFLLLSLLDV